MDYIKREDCRESFGVEEYLARRREVKKEEIKKEQEKFPEPFACYSSLLLMTL